MVHKIEISGGMAWFLSPTFILMLMGEVDNLSIQRYYEK
jgi:hypothetical protein